MSYCCLCLLLYIVHNRRRLHRNPVSRQPAVLRMLHEVWVPPISLLCVGSWYRRCSTKLALIVQIGSPKSRTHLSPDSLIYHPYTSFHSCDMHPGSAHIDFHTEWVQVPVNAVRGAFNPQLVFISTKNWVETKYLSFANSFFYFLIDKIDLSPTSHLAMNPIISYHSAHLHHLLILWVKWSRKVRILPYSFLADYKRV